MDTLNMPSNENNTEPNHGAAGNAVHKFHKLRSVLASAVTVTAVTSVVALCSGCNGQSVSSGGGGTNGSDSATAATSQEQETSISNNPLDTIDSSQDDSDWPTIIHKEKTDNDGVILTTDELAQAAGVGDTTELAEQSPEYACTLLEEWADYYDLGVTECFVGNYNDMPMPIISTGYKTEDGTYYLITIGVKPSSDQFIIQIGRGDGSGETYSYESSGLPDSDRLEEIIRTNNL